MADWFSRLSGKNKSADDAKERLKLVLIHDRTDLKSSALDDMKDEIINVISHHVAIDRSKVNIEVMHDGREQRLVADIPILTFRKK